MKRHWETFTNSNVRSSFSITGRGTVLRRWAKLLIVIIGCSTLVLVQRAGAVTNNQLALSSSGSQANLATSGLNMTPDGRYIVFSSSADYLVSGDTNSKQDVFLRDTINDTTMRVSVASDGTQADGDSTDPIITNNGRYILFYSDADNLATITGLPAGASYLGGVYLHDTKTGTTELVAPSYYGFHGASRISVYASPDAVSEDGRFVYYDELDNDQDSPQNQIYVEDRLLNTVNLVSKADDGTEGDGVSSSASTSCDGRFVAFRSSADNLVDGDTNGKYDIFLVDTMGTHQVTDITLGANDNSSSPVISCDGNFIVFDSDASNLVAGDTNGKGDVFQYNIPQGTTELISIDDTGSSAGGGTDASGEAGMSADGRYVGFTGYSSTYGYNEAYLRDTWTNTTKLVSMNSSYQAADNNSNFQAVTSDGQNVIYFSAADNLGVSNPDQDIYLYQITDY